MTSENEPWDIFGKTHDGRKYEIGQGLSVGAALKLVNILNRDSKDDFFHHFYASQTEVGGIVATLLPGEQYGTAKALVAWLGAIGIVEAKGGGRYKIGDETLRGRGAVAERFATVNDDRYWVISRLVYKRP